MSLSDLEGPITANVINCYNRLPFGGEFGGFNGDCTEYSLIAAIEACRPDLVGNGAAFKAMLDAYTQEAINAGQASAGGAMTAANLAWLCQRHQIPYVQSDGAQWQHVLGAQGGYGTWPVIVQFANGQALPGNQQGVLGHAVCELSWDGGRANSVIANGDSANGQAGQLDVVSFADLAAAQPFCVTEIRLARLAPAPAVDLAGIIADAHAIIQKAGG